MRFLGLLLACSLAAAPPAAPRRLLHVPVWADAEAKPAFSATIEGRDSRVLAVRGPETDLLLTVVLDLSSELTLSEIAKGSLAEGLQKLPSNIYVALCKAQDGLRVLVDPTNQRETVGDAIRGYPIAGRAGLLDTIVQAERIADSILTKTSVRAAVLYVTDSDVSNYRADYTNPVINSSDQHDLSRRFPDALIREKISELSKSLAGAQAPVFIVHLRYRSEQLNQAYQNGLKELAETTGGQATFCRSTAEIPEAVQRSLGFLSRHYSVTIALPERAARQVQVQIRGAADETLNYRSRFLLRGR